MAAHTIIRTQKIPVTKEEAWAFFSSPANLSQITPPGMGFRIISKFHGTKMYAGQLIEYTVSPVLNIRLYWMTEITHVAEGSYFVDEQRFGPYALWHHQHHFKAIPGGVEMTDIIHYKIPWWGLGRLGNSLFVGKKLNRIFDHRFRRVEEIFGKWER